MERHAKNVAGCREILCLILAVLNLSNPSLAKSCREGILKNWTAFQHHGGIQALNNNKLKHNNL